MQFADLLQGAGFNLGEVAIMLHQPSVAGQRAALGALAEDAPELFERYQDNHPKLPEATLKARKFAASFVVNDHGDARFVGLYRINGWEHRSYSALAADPLRQELASRIAGEGINFFDTREGEGEGEGEGRAVFDMSVMEALSTLKGRLVVPRPAGRAYVRLAETCVLPIKRIDETARFIPPMPGWNELVLNGKDIRGLPGVWAERLSQWRGIYLIVDQTDGARYVGSAYGAENLHARWLAHVRRDKGITVELSKRDPLAFRFTILERTSPDLPAEEVIAIEQSWKTRLDTVTHGLNRN